MLIRRLQLQCHPRQGFALSHHYSSKAKPTKRPKMTQKRMGKEFEKIIRTRRGMSELAKALDQISRDTNQGGEFEPCCTSFKEAAKKMHPGCLLALRDKTSNLDGYTALHIACSLGAHKMIPFLINAGDDPNQPNNRGVYPLHIAMSNGSVRCVDMLLRLGADPKATDAEGNSGIYWAVNSPVKEESKQGTAGAASLLLQKFTKEEQEKAIFHLGKLSGKSALHLAAENGHWQFFTLLLHLGFSLHQTTSHGDNILHLVCKQNKEPVIHFLMTVLPPEEVQRMAGQRNLNGQVPLHLLVSKGSVELVALMLDRTKVDIDIQDEIGLAPLHVALQSSNLAAAYLLIGAGAWLEIATEEGWRPLHYAMPFVITPKNKTKDPDVKLPSQKTINDYLDRDISNEKIPNLEFIPEVVRMLIEKANVNAKTTGGESALFMACIHNALHNVAYLIEHGAEVNIFDSMGNTPLHVAAAAGNISLTLVLLKHGARVNEYNGNNETPLHHAISTGNWGVTYYLLAGGANVEAPTAEGHRALHIIASMPNSASIMKIFVKKGVQLNSLTEDGMTPLDIALKHNNPETAKVLAAAGGRPNFYKDSFPA